LATLKRGTKEFDRLAETLDDLITLDLTSRGLIGRLVEITKHKQKGPMCLAAADLAVKACSHGGPALIATGFPMGAGVPETDGPVGAAMLARALYVGLGVSSVIVTDEDWRDCIAETCRGGGMAPLPLPESGVVPKLQNIRPVFVMGVPKDTPGAHRAADHLLAHTKPSLLVAIERPGMNRHGVYHGSSGRVIGESTADLDYLFRKGAEMRIPSIAFGDAGNELGFGDIQDELPGVLPSAKDCGCPCHGGVAAATPADVMVMTDVSNWGVTGMIAALALVLGNPAVLHPPEAELRSLDYCVAAGGLEGETMAPEPGVDLVPAVEWLGLLRVMQGILARAWLMWAK